MRPHTGKLITMEGVIIFKDYVFNNAGCIDMYSNNMYKLCDCSIRVLSEVYLSINCTQHSVCYVLYRYMPNCIVKITFFRNKYNFILGSVDISRVVSTTSYRCCMCDVYQVAI